MANRRRSYSEEDAPYQQSRAALRDRYGSRSIGYAGQAANDYTPSGRLKYKEQNMVGPFQSGEARERAAKMEVARDFRNNFVPRAPGFDPVANQANSPWRGVTAATGTYTPSMEFAPAPTSPPRIPDDQPPSTVGSTALEFNLSEPSTLPGSVIAPYADVYPNTLPGLAPYTPAWKQQPQPSNTGSVLSGSNKWLSATAPTYPGGAPVPKFHQDFNSFMDRGAPAAAASAITSLNPVFRGVQKAAGGLSDLVDPSTTGGTTVKRWLNRFSGRRS